MKQVAISALILIFTGTAAVGAADLHFVVYGVDESLGGMVIAGVFASEDGYLEPGFEVGGTGTVMEGDTAYGVFEDLPPGRYVVAVVHDLDGDKLMKKSPMGLPREGYAFSGTTRAVTFPPKFNKAAVELGSEDVSVDAYMKY